VVGEGEIHNRPRQWRVRPSGIERLHLEQDAGKSLHDQHPDLTLYRFERAGRRIDGDRQPTRYAILGRGGGLPGKMRAILRYLGTCDGNMEAGSMRADVNVSVRRRSRLGARCEIKNVNSMRFHVQGGEFEARRQIDILEAGGSIRQETRLFDSKNARPAPCVPRRRRMITAIFPDADLLP